MPASARFTVLRNARLVDGTGAGPRPGVDVVLESGKIASVGGPHPGGEAEVIDLQGRTLMPGLIDCHVHLTFSGEPQEVERAATVPVPDLAWTAAVAARETLDGGITTVRDVGARAGVAIRLREAIAAGRLPGPRMRAAGAIICMTGGHGWFIGREADGPDEVRRAVREQLKAGADCLKFTATGGGMTPGWTRSLVHRGGAGGGVEEAHRPSAGPSLTPRATPASGTPCGPGSTPSSMGSISTTKSSRKCASGARSWCRRSSRRP
jgi:imidazolonepropionase-like amidohydrolase